MRELVDLYGAAGFDVLAVTDHIVRTDDPWTGGALGVPAARFERYLEEIRRESERASRVYGMTLIPGAELTFNHPDPARAVHVVALGLDRFVPVDDIDGALAEARAAGAALVAAHPFAAGPAQAGQRTTQRFAHDAAARALVDRFELFNRDTLFEWVSRAGLPAVASGDFHQRDHLPGWKTLIPSGRSPEAVVAYLRSSRPVHLTRHSAAASRAA